VVFRPHFLVATHYDEDGVLEEDEGKLPPEILSQAGQFQ
jgi:hypothetical protein